MGSASLAPGANARVPENGQLLVVVGWEPNNRQGVQIDAFAFMIGADGRVSSDHYFVFYGSQVSPEGSVRFVPSPSSGNACEVRTFNVEPGKVPADVQSIDVCVVIRGSPAGGPSFGSLDNASALLTDLRSGQEIARFELPVEGMKETAITLVKIYRRNGQWKVRAVGQGFAGGFPALASHYGVGIADGAPLSTSTENTPAPPPRATPSTPAPPTKVTLAKRGQSVSLEKKGGEGFGQIVINLNWNQRPRRKGSLLGGLLGGSKGIDLDLGCLWELEDGLKGVVQALGEAWGDYRREPFIQHGGDDRTGAVAEGENIRVNGSKLLRIKRILVFAFIYEGVPNWGAADGVATVKVPRHHDIEVKLDNPSAGQAMCAIALIEQTGGRLKVTKEERYFRSHSDMDNAYLWGLRWVVGSKR